MAKYIDVKVSLEKTIKVDNDNLEEALKIAENQFPDLELTSEWLNAREVTFKENLIIGLSAEKLAELYHNNFDKKDLEELLDLIFGNTDIKECIYNETISILKNKYHMDEIDINL